MLRSEAESGLGEDSAVEGRPVLDTLEPVFHDRSQLARDAAETPVAGAVLHV
jgi:hypothetical protein